MQFEQRLNVVVKRERTHTHTHKNNWGSDKLPWISGADEDNNVNQASAMLYKSNKSWQFGRREKTGLLNAPLLALFPHRLAERACISHSTLD